MRARAKWAVERALVWSGVARAHRRAMTNRVLIVAYHNVIPDDVAPAGDLPNHLPLRHFVAQVDALRVTHEIVPLEDALTPARTPGGRPRAAITFDDAYRGAIRHAVPALARRGLPATIFVAPARLGGQQFWWDTLAPSDGAGLEPALRDRALGALRGMEEPILDAARAEARVLARMAPDFRSATVEEMRAALAGASGIVLGSHSWSHANLARLDDEVLAAELRRPLEWLRVRDEPSVPWIAYPYGSFDERVANAAQRAGYAGGLGITGGWVHPEAVRRFALPRVNIPSGLSREGFLLRGAGLLCD